MTSELTHKFILDATAGKRMIWQNKQHPNCIYLDERKEVNPDIIGDFRDLKEFKDESFNLIVFDPPHHTQELPSEKRRPNRFTKCYGNPLNPETWAYDIEKGITECLRVLKPYGVLVFKWTTINIKIKTLKHVFPIKPLFGQRVTNGKLKNKTQTWWFIFMKIPEGEI